MHDHPIDARSYTLISNARRFRFDAHLEKAADLFDADPHAWAKLPVPLQDASGVYRDLRADYREAVDRGLVTKP